MEIRPLSDALGAEISGFDLRDLANDPSPVNAIYGALNDHVVVVLRDQRISPAEYVEAMRHFGTLAPQNHIHELHRDHPEIFVIDSREGKRDKDGKRIIFGANSWHTDHTNQQRPPKITALHAQLLPRTGGDTCFANAYLMYERLPETRRRELDRLRTVNGADKHMAIESLDANAFAHSAIHPLVRRHPETGRHALYVHPLKMQRIENMDVPSSDRFVADLLDTTLTEDVVYRHRWQDHDLVLIDNRACLHRAERDYDPDEGRVMHRIIVEGDVPVH